MLALSDLPVSQFQPDGLAVDIDDTLCDTAATCISLMQKRFGKPKNMSTADILQMSGQPGVVPEWQTAQAQEWLAEQLNSDTFLLDLPQIPDALEFVHKITKQHPISLYITSRTESLLPVTTTWLKKHNFPLAPVVARNPHVREPDWKMQFMAKHNYKLHAFIDNDPAAFISSATPNIKKYIWLDRFGLPFISQKSAVTQADAHDSIKVIRVQSWLEIFKLLEVQT